jgi:hypothetical protein
VQGERAYLTLRRPSAGLFGMLPLAAPALPLDEAGKYVAGAYVVFLVLIVVYVAIMAAKLQRIERELRELASFAEQGKSGTPGREAEDVPVDSAQPAAVSDRNLTPSEAAVGPANPVRGAPDV